MRKLFLQTTILLSTLLLSACNSQPDSVQIQPTPEISATTPETSKETTENIGETSETPVQKVESDSQMSENSTADTSLISEIEAKEIALNHANVDESNATFLKVKLDYDNGVPEFEIEFYVDNMEYDYEIDANTGEIRSFDYEAETSHGNTQNTVASDGAISELQAKEIAFTHAGLSETDVSRLKVEFDYDDGIPEYEIEFYVGSTEYDYEIHGSSGEILSFGKETGN